MNKKLLILFFLGIIPSLFAQNLVQKFDGIPFNVSTGTSMAPFNGGMDNARIQFIDIDNDGKKDLFMYDRDTLLYYYANIGTSSSPNFKLITRSFQDLAIKNWFAFVDIDNDGDFDLFGGGEAQTVRFFRNTGTAGAPNFVLEIPELHTNTGDVVYSESNCVPTFCDIDNDGTKDFFTGTAVGQVTFYKNIGTSTNFNFQYVTDFWQNLLIISPALNPRHGANALEFASLNGSGINDLFWGDLYSHGIYRIRNDGTLTNPNMVVADSSYPHPDSYYSLGYNSQRFTDIDNDGKKDLFVSVLYLSQTKDNFTYYKNVGTASVPSYQRMSNNYLNNVDAGSNSQIAFTDINNDGKKDLFIGNDLGQIEYFKNTGTATSPAFTLITEALPLSIAGYNASPAFADLDGNGTQDLLVGTYYKDSIYYFKNIGTPENYNFQYMGTGLQALGLTNLGQASTPTFVDIDNDGDKDLFLGNSNGKIYYYRNEGTPQVPHYAFVTDFYSSIDVGDDSTPRFADIDGDGDYDLFIGNRAGTIWFYLNAGSASSPNFVLQTTNYKNINVFGQTCPEFVDIDADTDKDLFIGNLKGGIYYYENRDIVGIKNISTSTPDNFKLFQNYPNPFNPTTNIKFNIQSKSFVQLSVYDINGKLITQLVNDNLNSGSYESDFNADEFKLSSGIYFYVMTATNGKSKFVSSQKMILIK
ncbi:MAG: T9SS type A sorting domain-containing protein [Bacteroidetes bacterium]|nr:T9SS type A sorting domain-containing protein [Bacteroidota bacterium]